MKVTAILVGFTVNAARSAPIKDILPHMVCRVTNSSETS